MLLPRVLTALVGIPLLLGLVHLGSLPFAAFVVAVAVLSLYEYSLLLFIGAKPVQRAITVLGGGLLAATISLGSSGPYWPSDATAGAVITALLLSTLLREMFRAQHSLDRAAFTFFGIFFIGWTLPHLALIRDLRPDGEKFTFLLFVSVWIMDSAAYFVGLRWGRRPLAPVISPKKTWEGAAAGLLAAVACVLAARSWFLREALSLPLALALGLLIGTVGQLSDLAESVLKRAVGAKDSSALLPGHGGVLDRFDSFLLAAPMMYYMLALTRP